MNLQLTQCDICSSQHSTDETKDEGWKTLPPGFLDATDTEKDLCPACVEKAKKALISPDTPEYTPASLAQVEKEHILHTLNWANWHKTQASSILGIQRSTLDRKLREYQIERPKA